MYAPKSPATFFIVDKEIRQRRSQKDVLDKRRAIGQDYKIAEASAVRHRVCDIQVAGKRQHECHNGKHQPHNSALIAAKDQHKPEYKLKDAQPHGSDKHERARL